LLQNSRPCVKTQVALWELFPPVPFAAIAATNGLAVGRPVHWAPASTWNGKVGLVAESA
jgi:hypothetical protein